jgi:hypothetical protein
MFKFAIEQGGPSRVQVEKQTFAKFYVQILANGRPVNLPSLCLRVYVDGNELSVGSGLKTSIGNRKLELCCWGTFLCETAETSSKLMALKPHLPKLCELLAQRLCANHVPDGAVDLANQVPDGAVDLTTGQPFQPIKPHIFYKFTDERVEMVDESIIRPSRILFISMVMPRDKRVQGKAGALTVELTEEGGVGWYKTNHLIFSHYGWISVGVVNMRQDHDDATIKAAFQDLARNLLAQDATPTNAETWQASTKLELALE